MLKESSGFLFHYLHEKENPMAKYSRKAQENIEETMHEYKQEKLKSGSGKKVTSRKQAIAIGISESREKGQKVPAKKKSASAKKTTGRKKAARKSTSRKRSS